MDYQELKEKSREELKKLRDAQRAAHTAFRFHITTGQQKNVRAGRAARKTIARIATLLQQSVNNHTK